MSYALILTGGFFALFWIFLHGLGAVSLLRAHRLRDGAEDSPDLPSLAVVVPAANEEDTLQAALDSLRRQEYPDLRIVVVDDRSTDSTGGIADRLARDDSRVEALHVEDLPPGWLGKVHALDQGLGATDAEYVLFTDADVHFEPGALQRALALAVRERLDHLTLLPRLVSRGQAHATMMAAFFVGYIRRVGPSGRLVPGSRPVGYGAFNLVRRAAFEATEGFAWLRMDVLDDLALGALMLRSGARSGFAVAERDLSIAWYPGLVETLRGFEKNAFGGLAGYSLPKLFGMAFGTFLLALGPGLLLLDPAVTWTRPLVAVAVGCLLVEALAARWRFGVPFLAGALAPLSHLFMAYAMVRAGFACTRRGGIQWRGTRYDTDELRRGRRVSFP